MMDKHERLAIKHLAEKVDELKAELKLWRWWALNGGYFYNPVTKKIEEKEE